MAPRPRPRSRSSSRRCCCSTSYASGSGFTCWRSENAPELVIAGLDPAIHQKFFFRKGWMPGSSPGMTTSKFLTLNALLRRPAAVDRQVGPGDLGCIVAAQEQRQRSDLLDGDELLGRLCIQQHVVDDLLLRHIACLHGVGNLLLHQRRPDIAGADAIAGDL